MAGNNSLLSVLRATPLSNTIATQQWVQEEFTPISLLVNELSGAINPKLSTIADKVIEEAERVYKLSGAISSIAVNDGTLTIQRNGSNVATFTANQAENVSADIDVPTDLSDLTNNAGFVMSSDVIGKYLPLSGGEVSADFALKIAGSNVLSGLNGNLAIGKSSKATGNPSTALGTAAYATGNSSTALGYGAQALSSASTALGNFAQATGNYSTALGNAAHATGNYSTALGDSSKATGANSIALGKYTVAAAANSIQIGNINNFLLSNNVADTLQIWDKPLLERTSGKIFIDRIPISLSAVEETYTIQLTEEQKTTLVQESGMPAEAWGDFAVHVDPSGQYGYIGNVDCYSVSQNANGDYVFTGGMPVLNVLGWIENNTIIQGSTEHTVLSVGSTSADLALRSDIEGMMPLAGGGQITGGFGVVDLDGNNLFKVNNYGEVLIGSGATDYLNNGIAIGYQTSANSNSIAIGYEADALSVNSIALGAHAKATNYNAVQIGYGTNNSQDTLQFRNYPLVDSNGNIPYGRLSANLSVLKGDYLPLSGGAVGAGFALKIAGSNALSGLNENLAIGYGSQATSYSSTALGCDAKATDGYSTAVGDHAQATGSFSTALGYNAQAISSGSTALGFNTKATDGYSTAVGDHAQATGINSTALGFNTAATATNAIQIGGIDAFILSNNVANTLQIWNKPLLERISGKIFIDRIPTGDTSATVAIGDHTHSQYALKSDIPLSTSQLTNDSNFATTSQIPTVNNGILTIQRNGSNVATFTANQAENVSADIDVPTDLSDLTNNAGYAKTADIPLSTSQLANDSGFIASSQVDVKIDEALTDYALSSKVDGSIAAAISSLSTSLNQVAFTGSYNDLSDVPEVFPASNGVLTINVNGTNAGSFSADQSDNTVVNISIPLSTSQLSNDSDFATVSQIPTDYISNVVMNGDVVAVTDRSIDLGTILTAHQSLSDYALTSQLPIVNDGMLTIQRNGVDITSFTANQSSSVSVDIDVPLSVSQLSNDSNFVSEAKATEIRNVLPISESTASSIQLTRSTYVYRVTDETASGAFPTLVAPTDIENTGNYYFTFEIEWTTAAALASYSQTFDWINWPEIVQGSESHTYYIAGRYDNGLSSYTMNCWRTK